MTPSRSRRPSHPVRRDIQARILEAAGQLFADKGYFGTTGKEICARVGANAASVAYHFGGIANLYAAALEEAFARLADSNPLTAAPSSGRAARQRLTSLGRTIVDPSSWAARLISREIIAPTGMCAGMDTPKLRSVVALLEGAVSELCGLPHGHPAVALSCINIVAPFVILPLVSQQQLEELFPTVAFGSHSVEETTQHLARFALRGLAAMARDVKRRGRA
jgi:AcrR family transcriptional regulator